MAVARVRTSSRTPVAASPSIAATICASPPSPGTNDATSRPSRRTVHMSQWVRTSARRWEMNSTERLRSFHRRITAKTRSDRSGGRAAVISSSTSSCGSNASALARSSMRRNGSGRSRTCSSRSSPSRPIAASSARTAPTSAPDKRRFWATVRSGASAGSWNTGASPAAWASLGRRSSVGRPCRAIIPASARRTPVRILTIVDLPAPLAPSRAWLSPGRTVRSTARRATTGPKALATAVVWRSGSVNEIPVVSLRRATERQGSGGSRGPAWTGGGPLDAQVTPRDPCRRGAARVCRSCTARP